MKQLSSFFNFLLEKFSYTSKTRFIVGLCLAGATYAAVVLMFLPYESIQKLNLQITGILYQQDLQKLLSSTVRREIVSIQYPSSQKLLSIDLEINQDFSQLVNLHDNLKETLFASNPERLRTFDNLLKKFDLEWKNVNKSPLQSANASDKSLFQLIENIETMISEINYTSNLILNNDDSSNSLIDAIFVRLAKIKGVLPHIIFLKKQQPLNMNSKINLMSLEEIFKNNLDLMLHELHFAFSTNEKIRELFSSSEEQIKTMQNYTDSILNNDQVVFQVAEQFIMDEDAFAKEASHNLSTILKMQKNTLYLLAFIGILWIAFVTAIAMTFYATKVIRRPLASLKNAAEELGRGNLSIRVPVTTKDEVATMATKFNEAAQFFEEIIAKTAQIAENLLIPLSNLHSTSKQLESNAGEQENILNDIAKETKNILVAVQKFAQSVNTINQTVALAFNMATSSTEGMSEMKNVMNQIKKASKGIVSTLTALKEKVESTSKVIDEFVKIADQANLLFLNAAIHANKTGVIGIGFSVIAKKIREEADKTANVTLLIEEKMKAIIGTTSQAVIEVEKCSAEIEVQTNEVSQINAQFNTIIQSIHHQVEQFEQINTEMQEQAKRISQIHIALNLLHSTSQQTLLSSTQLYHKVKAVYHAALQLTNLIKKFKYRPIKNE